MNTFKRLALVVTLVVAMGAGFGCAKKQTGADVAPAVTADDNSAANAAIERAAQAITDGIVYFDFDKSDIKAESRDMLRQKAELMKAYPSIRVRIEGKKGVLWWSIYKIIQKNHPSYVLLENVDRLLKSPASQRGRDFGIILKCLQEEGYGIEWRVINAADYGCVQRRRRTFIFAFKNTTKQYERMTSCFSEDTKDGRVWLMQEGFFAHAFPVHSEVPDPSPITNVRHPPAWRHYAP